MNTVEICRLTRKSIAGFLSTKNTGLPDEGRRGVKRWPFPGTAELWLPCSDGTERYVLATTLNLSMEGTGIRCDEPLEIGLEIGFAMHEPEISMHGRAVVRHCTEMEGEYLIGIAFQFDADGNE